jgi:hypothetical protein
MTRTDTAISEVAFCPPMAQRLPTAPEISAYPYGSSFGRVQRIRLEKKIAARAATMRCERLRSDLISGTETSLQLPSRTSACPRVIERRPVFCSVELLCE